MEYYKLDLDNKIRIIHKYSDSFIAHLGIYINVGSRDEYNNEEGLAHFIEHTFFKGTKRRNVFQLLSRMENVGGEVNAFTTKEETCIYISFCIFKNRIAIWQSGNIIVSPRRYTTVCAS